MPKEEREMSKAAWLQMISMLQVMDTNNSLKQGMPNSSMWHAAQFTYYGSKWCTHVPWVILFLPNLTPKKFWKAVYLSRRVHSGGCQDCPAVEEMDPKKTCSVDGSVKDNCAWLDCCFDHLCSL